MERLPGFTPFHGRERVTIDLDREDAERLVALARAEAARTGERPNVAGMVRRVVREAMREARTP